jgi:hypothetical protein
MQVDEALSALERDLLAEGGPRISTMRNYNFAIVPYRPSDELALRRKVRALADRLRASGFRVLHLDPEASSPAPGSLGPDVLYTTTAREKRLWAKDPGRSLAHLAEVVGPLIEGPDGIAADVIREIATFVDASPVPDERSFVLIGRAGALFPFFRSSALLKNIDGHTGNLPVVLLYPGERRGRSSLSFMVSRPRRTIGLHLSIDTALTRRSLAHPRAVRRRRHSRHPARRLLPRAEAREAR